jgi:probable HAF family extracellular repeat protein
MWASRAKSPEAGRAGRVFDGDVTTHPFIWSKEEGMQELFASGGLGGTFGHPDWMNDRGEVVGFGTTVGDVVGHAFLWRRGTMIDLGTIGTDAFSEGLSIDSRGQVVGATFTHPGGAELRGFLWEKGGPMVDLNTLLVAGSNTFIVAGEIINDRGEIDCFWLRRWRHYKSRLRADPLRRRSSRYRRL